MPKKVDSCEALKNARQLVRSAISSFQKAGEVEAAEKLKAALPILEDAYEEALLLQAEI